jgi:membrane protein implicated in regulation of membrane protease activity
MLTWLGEYWQMAVVVGAGILVVAVRRRVPRWVLAAWALLAIAVLLARLTDMSWRGSVVLFVGLVLIASAFWLRAEERKAASQDKHDVSP